MERILVITGTRPEIIKMSPIITHGRADVNIDLIHADSSQHFDYNMNKKFFEELKFRCETGEFNYGAIPGHFVPNYPKVLEKGFSGIQKELKELKDQIKIYPL